MVIEIVDGENHLLIEPLEFAYPNSNTTYSRNVISTRIIYKVGILLGNYIGEFETVDFISFKLGLLRLFTNLNGFVRFDGLEPYLTLKIQGDGMGHYTCNCYSIHNPGFKQTEQTFVLHINKTQISSMITMAD